MKRYLSRPEIVGLIPARGGSRRILRKNLADLCGRPLIACSIDASRRAKRLTRTIVSTDDQEIAEVSRELGAEVPFMRPRSLATDEARSIDVIRHAARWLERQGAKPHAMVLLQPTSPLRTAAHIDAAVRLFFSGGCDSVVSVCELSGALSRGPQGKRRQKLLRTILPDGRLGARGGDTERSGWRSVAGSLRLCMLNGAVYVLGRRVLFKGVPIENDRTRAYIMPEDVSVDIDEREDLIAAARYLSRDKRRYSKRGTIQSQT